MLRQFVECTRTLACLGHFENMANDGIEDTEHFLLLCHAYGEDRRDLLNSVHAILRPHGLTNLSNENLLKILLHGHKNLSFYLNKKILEATLKYIQASERFQ